MTGTLCFYNRFHDEYGVPERLRELGVNHFFSTAFLEFFIYFSFFVSPYP